MKRIAEYKKLFNVENEIVLSDLKTSYRNLVKVWHPDKFQDGDEKAHEAELMSRKVIDGYHFLVSIAPETKAANLADYTENVIESGITDYKHKGLLLEVSFGNGMTYEYFGVSKNVFNKFHNSDKQLRFAKRNVFHTFLYRKSKSGSES